MLALDDLSDWIRSLIGNGAGVGAGGDETTRSSFGGGGGGACWCG